VYSGGKEAVWPFKINNDRAHDLARQIQQKTGESLTTAVIVALEERLRRVAPEEDKAARLARINEIIDRAASYQVLDNRTPEEIIGYDENGLPS
jgi:antitoxin VapB